MIYANGPLTVIDFSGVIVIDTYTEWKADGSPHEVARPIDEIHRSMLLMFPDAAVARNFGILGNTRHLLAQPPEDHCPYSHTGWPDRSPYPWVHAFDDEVIGFRHRIAFLIEQRRNGYAPWLKYANFLGWHYSWQPGYTKTPSSDDPGHGHVSARSDWTHRSNADGWQTVRLGATGTYVYRTQWLLNAGHGCDLLLDGVYGKHTEAAVKTFQDHRGITADGITGPRTRIELATAS